MLTHIHIWNFAIVEQLDLALEDGLTVLTGETGAGKSILLDALGLALGDRADNSVIRHGSDKAEISVTFDTRHCSEAEAWLKEHELDSENECIIRRTISATGPSKAFINGKPSPIQTLKELGEMLVDLHGQHEHHSLLRKEVQRQLLDELSNHQKLVDSVADTYRSWKQLQAEMKRLSQANSERDSRLELLRYQVNELETLGLEENEPTELENEHRKLANANQLLETSERVLNLLQDNELGSVGSLLIQGINDIQSLAKMDNSLNGIGELLDGAAIQIKEAASELRHYTDNLELDPQRLSWVEERLVTITDLSRKHHLSSKELPAHLATLQAELSELEEAEHRADHLQEDIEKAFASYLSQAQRLSESRKKAAKKMARQITASMQELGMEGGRFDIALEPLAESDYSKHGLELPEFVVSANPGQPLKALNKVASGGELSRISLAIQVISASASLTPTLIFDEVDVGIGGRVAEIVGRQLRQLGDKQQVICVTHLPQVAALGHHHLQVNKQADKKTTSSEILPLSQPQRVDEIARMLGGIKITEQTLNHAREMIEEAQV
ncbi:MAG: DNA repair protein RecN [Gammaproteobacteria bacterium]|nr:DNA repair protein RecN [Gammaproteobacteria bacterium]